MKCLRDNQGGGDSRPFYLIFIFSPVLGTPDKLESLEGICEYLEAPSPRIWFLVSRHVIQPLSTGTREARVTSFGISNFDTYSSSYRGQYIVVGWLVKIISLCSLLSIYVVVLLWIKLQCLDFAFFFFLFSARSCGHVDKCYFSLCINYVISLINLSLYQKVSFGLLI